MEDATRTSGSRTERALANWLWMASGAGAQGLLNVLVLAVLAHLLSPRDFGLASASLLLIRLSLLFSQVGVGPALVQHPKLNDAHVEAASVFSIALGVVLLAVLWFAAPAIAVLLHAPALTPIVRALAWTLPLQAASLSAEFLLRRELQFRAIATYRVASYTLGYAVVGIVLAALGYGVWALAGAQLTQAATNSVLLIRRRRHSWRISMRRRELGELLDFGGGFTLARLGNYCALYGDYTVVVTWLGVVALGLYERAYQLMAMPATLIGQVLDEVLFPAIAQIQDDTARVRAAYRRSVGAIALATLPVTVVVVMLAPELIRVVLGAKWTAAILPFQILALGTLFRTSYKVSDSLTRALGAVYARAWRQWVYAALVVGGALLGRSWGISGVAVGVLFSLVGNFLLMAHLSLRLLGLGWGEFLRAHVAGMKVAIVVGVPLAAVTIAMRGTLPDAAVALLAILAGALAGAAALFLATNWVLGEDGRWLLRRTTDFARRRLQRVRPSVEHAT